MLGDYHRDLDATKPVNTPRREMNTFDMSIRLRTDQNLPALIKSATMTQGKNDFLRKCSSTFNNLGTKAMNEIRAIPSAVPLETFSFTKKDLQRYLYGKKEVGKIDLERILRKRKLLDDENTRSKQSRILIDKSSKEFDNIEMTYSIMSFPNDVQLCYSSIPGYKLGVSSTKHMPIGTWIGPYEGKRVSMTKIDEYPTNPSYSWEIYKDGKLDHFLDGSDKHSSSWMRYVRCARNHTEQNMFMIQYGPNIFYRSFKEIKPGEELLVWYENQYEQYFGIPMFIKLNNFGVPPETPTNQGMQRPQPPMAITQNANVMRTPSPAYHTEHDGLPPNAVNETFTSSVHYGGYTRQDSLGSLSPPFTASPVASPTATDHTALNHDALEHQEIGLWQCRQCSQRFTQRSALRLHVCPCQASNPYYCGHCNISFPDPSKLRNHVLTHKHERPFKCGFCSRTFAGATTLNNHVRTHTGQKPFTCERCGKAFSQASQVSRHQRIAEDCK